MKMKQKDYKNVSDKEKDEIQFLYEYQKIAEVKTSMRRTVHGRVHGHYYKFYKKRIKLKNLI